MILDDNKEARSENLPFPLTELELNPAYPAEDDRTFDPASAWTPECWLMLPADAKPDMPGGERRVLLLGVMVLPKAANE